MIFDVDPDIRRARTLPSNFYLDADLFEISKRRIFERAWHLIGRVADAHRLEPVQILPGFLNEPVLLSRTAEGIRCLSNVCTHRGKVLVEQPCEANLIRCGYHGRRFSLEGRFLSMPEFEGVEGFPAPEDDLHVYSTAARGGFVFASIAPVGDIDEVLGEAGSIIREYDDIPMDLVETRVYDVAAHWALYCENYLEGFHIPYVHRALNDVVDYGTYTTETFRYASLQTGYGDDRQVAGRYLFVFPNTMFNFYHWGISVNVVEPIGPAQTRVRFLKYVADESKLAQGAGADLHGVELEDEAVVESVQRGIRSRFYDRGRYSPSREQGTHHFHRLIAEFMKSDR